MCDDDSFLIAIEDYHYNVMESSLGISQEDVEKNGTAVRLTTDGSNVLEEYFIGRDFKKLEGSERLVIRCNTSII